MYRRGESKGEAKAIARRFEAHGMKMPEPHLYDPKPMRTTRAQDEARLTPGGGPQPVMACPVG